MKYFLILAFNTILFFACTKKELPTNDAGKIVFAFTGSIDNANFNLAAGKNNYYMYTNVYKDVQNIYTCEGKLAKTTDTNADYIKLSIKNYTYSSFPNIDSLFSISEYKSYSTDTATTKILKSVPVVFYFTGKDSNVQSYFWDFGDGTTSTQKNPSHLYTIGSSVSASCLVKYNNGIQDFLQNTIQTKPNTIDRNTFSITQTGNTIICNSIPNNANCVFTLPDGTTQTGATATYSKPITTRGLITMRLGNTVYQQVIAPSNSTALVNFIYTAKDSNYSVINVPANNLHTAILEVKRNNKFYTSNNPNAITTPVSILQIIAKNIYEKNTAGQRTAKVDGKCGLYMYNTTNTNDSIWLESNLFTLGLAFP